MNTIYGKSEIGLKDRKLMASKHPEVLLYLMTVSRFDRTGSISGKEPLGHMTLASYLQMVGWEVRVFAGNTYDALAVLEERKESDSTRTVLVGLYCDYENMDAIVCLARRIKDRLGYGILMGGPQSVALNESFMRKYPFVDAFIRGDGEYSVSDVLSAYACGKPEARFEVRGIGGLLNDRYIDNGVSEPLVNLDEAPPVRDISMIYRGKRTALAALSGRGCPFHCSFCYEGGNSKTVRLRSVEHMMHELEVRFTDHPEAKYVYFGDDTFTLQPDRLAEFCNALKELRKKHDFVWFADGHVRVLLKHPEYLPMMLDAGLRRMQIGIESTCQPIIDLYQKNIKKEELYKTVDLCRDAGLPQLIGNIIIGGAMETKETIRETFDTIYDLIRRSKGMLDVTSTLYSDFPGTAISSDPDGFGLKIMDPEGLTSFGDYPIAETTGLTRDEIAALRKEFIVGTARLMKECVASGDIDERRMLQNMELSKRYGLSCLWVSFGLTRNNSRYYKNKCGYGTDYDDSDAPLELIPVRSVYFHNETKYVEDIPSVSGYVLTPLEDELLHWSAGKLTVAEILDKLWEEFKGFYGSRSEFDEFAVDSLKKLEKKRLLVFVDIADMSGRAKKEQQYIQERQNKQEKQNKMEEKRKKKILLFYPYTLSSVADKTLTGSTQGIYILAAILKKMGYEPMVCECVFNRIIETYIEENDGNICAVGMSVDYENRRLVLRICKKLAEEHGVKVILGGVDARTLKENELIDCKSFAVIKGEGEITLPKVISCLEDPDALFNVPGLLLIKDGKLVDTGEEEPPADLDAIPFPDYSLSREPVSGDSFYILTSRGCPNHCAFCHEGTYKTKLRMRSIPNVMEEIHQLFDKYPKINYLMFCDDTLVCNPKRVLPLCEGLKELRKTYDFEWYCEADVLSLYRNPEILPAMIDAGLVRLQIGIESGSDEMLKIYEKNLTTDMVRSVVKRAYDLGLPSMVGPLLVGSPFESPANIEEQKRWIEELIRLAPGMIELPGSIISPYSQTKIGRDPKRYGYTFTDAEGDGSNTDYPGYYTEQMTEKQILAGYQEITMAGALASRSVIDEGLVSYERLKKIVEIHTKRDTAIWGKIVNQGYPMIFSYFQLALSCKIPPLRDVDRNELPEWHIQRTFEIWRFVNFSGDAVRIGNYVLSPYEYQLILYCAGKLTVRSIAERMYDDFGGGDTLDAFEERIIDTLLFFETKYWVVGVPY